MKIKDFTKIKKKDTGGYYFDHPIGRTRTINIDLDDKDVIKAGTKPILLEDFNRSNGKCCAYKNYLIFIEGIGNDLDKEESLTIKHFVLKKEKELEKIAKEVEAFENFDKTQTAKRERIPGNIRLFVWQRDEGKCVKCGSKEKLEFDHIIPFVEGGSNTERNIQLLCENCNRSKGKNI